MHANVVAVQCDPVTWGPDALEWRPDRWITRTDQGEAGNESLLEPKPGTFLPWSLGPRVCPGRKFSQVEFVAVVSRLLWRHRVRPKQLEGEALEDAQRRVLKVVNDSAVGPIVLSMRNSESVSLIWEEL